MIYKFKYELDKAMRDAGIIYAQGKAMMFFRWYKNQPRWSDAALRYARENNIIHIKEEDEIPEQYKDCKKHLYTAGSKKVWIIDVGPVKNKSPIISFHRFVKMLAKKKYNLLGSDHQLILTCDNSDSQHKYSIDNHAAMVDLYKKVTKPDQILIMEFMKQEEIKAKFNEWLERK